MSNASGLKSKSANKILVVEDEGEIGLILGLAFHNEKFQLDYVSNLLLAEEYLHQQEPSIILLDNKLPDGYGVDFIGAIKKKYPSIKIIMISGFGSARDLALENGADMFFEKPFSLDELQKAINQLLT